MRSVLHAISSLLSVLSLTSTLAGQSLPDAMFLSSDGHILYTNGQPSSGLYREDSLRSIHLNFNLGSWWGQMQSNYQTQTPIPATMVVDGVTYDSVAVRFKGQTSYSQLPPGSQKMSFDVDVDGYIAGQELKGYGSLNFNNSFQDNSFMREVVYLHLIRRHIPAAKANFIKLYLNGQNWGLYPNVQGLDGTYLSEWYFTNNGTRWRADRPNGQLGGGGGGWGDGTTALNYLGADTALYQPYYTLQKAHKPQPWDDLVRVCDKLNNTPLATLYDTLERHMDVDRVLWFLACEIAFSDDDSYAYKGKMDYCLYWDEVTGRMTTQEYDGNSVMESQNMNWGPFFHANDVNYPLLNRLMQVPELRQRYLAHFRTVIDELLDPTQAQQLIADYATMIDTVVQNDPKKLMTYAQFSSAWTALQGLFTTRVNTLNTNTEVTQVAPVIGSVDHFANGVLNASPAAGDGVTVRATVTSGNGISEVTLFWCPQLYGRFQRLAMFDDGAHDDGAAADGVFGATLPGQIAGLWVRYYVEARAGNTALSTSYAPPGAEHDVFVYQVMLPAAPQPSVVLNEVMAKNAYTAQDEYNEAEDWIELFNPTSAPIDLSGWFLTDSPFNLTKWTFPAGTMINGNDYLIVWADEDGWQAPLHANFKLSGDGEDLRLINADTMLVDAVSFGPQVTDLGYARLPNGFGPFVIQQPTFAASNDFAVIEEQDGATLVVFPNPSSGFFTLLTGTNETMTATVLDATLRQVWSGRVKGRAEIDASSWSAGTYILRAGNTALRLVVVR